MNYVEFIYDDRKIRRAIERLRRLFELHQVFNRNLDVLTFHSTGSGAGLYGNSEYLGRVEVPRDDVEAYMVDVGAFKAIFRKPVQDQPFGKISRYLGVPGALHDLQHVVIH